MGSDGGRDLGSSSLWVWVWGSACCCPGCCCWPYSVGKSACLKAVGTTIGGKTGAPDRVGEDGVVPVEVVPVDSAVESELVAVVGVLVLT